MGDPQNGLFTKENPHFAMHSMGQLKSFLQVFTKPFAKHVAFQTHILETSFKHSFHSSQVEITVARSPSSNTSTFKGKFPLCNHHRNQPSDYPPPQPRRPTFKLNCA